MAGHQADYDKEYDTDEISLTSTVSSIKTETYVVEEILSQGWTTFADGSEGTWEPKENLDGTNFIQMWDQKKRQMGANAAQEYMAKNEADFKAAEESFIAAKEYRRAKRAMKRRNLREKRRRSVTVVDEDKNEEDISPRLQEWVSEQRAVSPETALATREDMDSSQLNSLFVESQVPPTPGPTSPPGQPAGGLFVEEPPVVRNSPLQQSDSSSEEEAEEEAEEGAEEGAESFDDSLIGRVEERSTRVKSKTADAITPRGRRRVAEKPVQAPETSIQVQKGTDPMQKSQPPTSMAVHTSSFTHPKAGAAKRTAPTRKQSGGIKIVNEPKTQQRGLWQNSEKLYSNLRFRGLADKRSRIEGTPDPGALEIINAPAGFVKPRPQPRNDNPYGRREAGNRRDQDDDVDDAPRRGSVDATTPLENWEAEKAPLVCAHWRLSNNCPLGPQKCQFMHRNQDENGRDYPVGDLNGWLPPKYRKPPLTCPYWLTSKNGCKKPQEECNFAHKNTGWIPLSENRRDEPFAIDPNAIPESEKTARRPLVLDANANVNDKKKMNPSDLTCWYWWSKDNCRNSADRCTFQHHYTGIVADPPHRLLTCRFWADGDRCRSSAENCKFEHYHTGVISGQFGNMTASATTQPHLGFHSDRYVPSPILKPVAAVDTEMEDVAQPSFEQNVVMSPQHSPIEQPPRSLIEQPPAKMTCLQMKAKIEQVCKLDFTDMFKSNNEDAALLDRRAFLIYHPEEHLEELDLIMRWLLMHHVEVGNAWYDGSWDNFKQQILKGGSGVIIAHPDFEYFTELPGFGQVLRMPVRLWSVGLQEGIEYDPALTDLPPELRQDQIEIFPLGGFIYITDEVFAKKPQVALNIVQSFFAKIQKLQQIDDADLLWRVCVRPELMEYLMHHCENHAQELEAGDADVTSIAELYTILAETNYIEQDDPTTPLSLIPDNYPIISERRVIAEVQPVDYFNTLSRSQEDANLHMIRYYAGLQVDMRRDYRQFFVVHTEPEATTAKQWKQEIQTIAEIMTPEKCVAELAKEGGEGLFDFYERYMAEYQVKDANDTQVVTEGVENLAV
ncbi:Nn.00g078850.m01.CDS01 [Neocucurbitaria sp. VM-36]